MPAIAGRSMPAMVCRQILDIAISAPVLPAETATSASPRFTASMARHIDETRRPARSAWLGLSSMRTATSVCWNSDTAATFGCWSRIGRTSDSRPKTRKLVSGWRMSEISAPAITTEGP